MGSGPSIATPIFEKVLQDALKPYSFEHIQSYIKTMKNLLKHFNQKLNPVTIGEIQEIIRFFQHLEKFSTGKKRSEWYSETYKCKAVASQRPAHPGHDNPMKTAKFSSMNDEMERLNRELNKSEHERKKLERSLSEKDSAKDVKEENKQLKGDLSNLLKDNEKLIRDADDLQIRLAMSQSETDELKQKMKRGIDELTAVKDRLKQESNDLRQRLAQEMSDKVAKDESSLENINIKNRPMKVAEEYAYFCSNAWFEAKERLDKAGIPSLEALRTLADTLKCAEKYAKQKEGEVTHRIYSVFSKQANEGAKFLASLPPQRKMETIEVKKIPEGLKNAIGDFLRVTADTADISAIVQEIKADSKPSVEASVRATMCRLKESEKRCLSMEHLGEYLEECARLAWKMAVQRPPMTFDDKLGIGQKWMGPKIQEVYFGSENPDASDSVVHFYVYPILKHKEAIMVKGSVFVGKAKDFIPVS